MKPSASNPNLAGIDLDDQNQNTVWMSFKGAWASFPLGLLVLRFLLWVVGFGSAWSWSLVHIAHVVTTFYYFHWIKGSPVDNVSIASTQGKFDKLTWWEQLDSGVQWTSNKKFLASLVLFTYTAAVHATDYWGPLVLLHTVFLAFGLVPKLPGFYRVRLFGINED